MASLFTYGSLMCADIMCRVAGCRPAALSAELSGYRRSSLQGRLYPAIVPSPGGRVSGVLYLDLPASALHRLDIFEGELYRREDLAVVTGKGEEQPAMGYVLRAAYHHLLTNTPWDFAEFTARGKKPFEEAYLGFQQIAPPAG